MPEQLPFTALLNRIFAGPVDALLRALHIQPEFSQAPISNAVAMEVLVVGFLILVFLLLRARGDSCACISPSDGVLWCERGGSNSQALSGARS